MSWWRRTTVLRIPASKLGFTYRREWDAFLKEHEKDFHWKPGHFDESLADDYPFVLRWEGADFYNPDWRLDQRNPKYPDVVPGPFLDYKLEEIEPIFPEDNSFGADNIVEPLDGVEMHRYLPRFQKLFPEFTLEDMEAVRYCRYEWYDGSNAPYLYSDWDRESVRK